MVFGRVTSGQAVVDAVEQPAQGAQLAVPELGPRTTSVCASLRGSGGLEASRLSAARHSQAEAGLQGPFHRLGCSS